MLRSLIQIISSTDELLLAVLGGSSMRSVKWLRLVPGAANTGYFEVCGTLHEVWKAKLALGTDSEPSELRKTLHKHALPPPVIIVWNVFIILYFVDIPYAYHSKSSGDVRIQLSEISPYNFYAWDAVKLLLCLLQEHKHSGIRSSNR